MRKRLAFRKLGRTSTHKWAMLRNMVTSLIKHERIQTTEPKAKELRKLADKMVGHAKNGTTRILICVFHIPEVAFTLDCIVRQGNFFHSFSLHGLPVFFETLSHTLFLCYFLCLNFIVSQEVYIHGDRQLQ